jgi:hypothetical protein
LFPEARVALSAEQRTLRAKIAAHTRWSRDDPVEGTAAAREVFLSRFAREVREANPELSDAEVERRAAQLRRAYFAKLALASSKARAARKASRRVNLDHPAIEPSRNGAAASGEEPERP